jgi:hypothetical protein
MNLADNEGKLTKCIHHMHGCSTVFFSFYKLSCCPPYIYNRNRVAGNRTHGASMSAEPSPLDILYNDVNSDNIEVLMPLGVEIREWQIDLSFLSH